MSFDTHCHLDFLQQRMAEKPEGEAEETRDKFVFKTFKEFKEKYYMGFEPSFRGCIANFCEPELFMNNEYEEMFKHDQDVW